MKAFPTTAQTWDIHNGRDLSGMDLRDYFAAKAMQELVSVWVETDLVNSETISKDAYRIADAMMKARNETP